MKKSTRPLSSVVKPLVVVPFFKIGFFCIWVGTTTTNRRQTSLPCLKEWPHKFKD